MNKIFQSIQQAIQGVIGFVSGAVARIFRPSDDDYPETGAQPYEGDIPDKKEF
jgi:hypothetical protein